MLVPRVSYMSRHSAYSVDSDVGVVIVYVVWPRCCRAYQDPHDHKKDGGRQGDLALKKIHLPSDPVTQSWAGRETHILQIQPLLCLFWKAHI
jgi:hypothetical protein